MKNNLLTVVDNFSFLGLKIDKELKWNERIQYIANKIIKPLDYSLDQSTPSPLCLKNVVQHLNMLSIKLLFNIMG